MVNQDRTSFVMGEIHFRFIGPAAFGDRVTTTISLAEIGERTIAWNCSAHITATGAPVTEGRATRVYARINADGKLTSMPIPGEIKKAL
jgi:acyl-CoA thioesterase FadM